MFTEATDDPSHIFNGLPVFYILGKEEERIRGTLENGSETHRPIGDAYLHEWMSGETEEMNIEERDIVMV